MLDVALPRAARAGCTGVDALDGKNVLAIRSGQPAIKVVKPLAIRVQLLAQCAAIGCADVTPHLRRTGGDAGEIAKAAGGVVEVLVCPRHAGQHVHQRKRQQMRQMAHCGEHIIMLDRAHAVDDGACGLPHSGHPMYRVGMRLCTGADDHLARLVERRERRGGAGVLGAGNGMRRHELVEAGAQRRARSRDDILFGAAAVGHHCPRAKPRRQ